MFVLFYFLNFLNVNNFSFKFKNLDAHLQLNKKKRSIENVKTISLKNGQHIPISLTNLIETNLNEHHEELRHQMKVKIEVNLDLRKFFLKKTMTKWSNRLYYKFKKALYKMLR